jgi:hypothetical protein
MEKMGRAGGVIGAAQEGGHSCDAMHSQDYVVLSMTGYPVQGSNVFFASAIGIVIIKAPHCPSLKEPSMFDFSLPPATAVLPIEGHDVAPPDLSHALTHMVATQQVFAKIGDTLPPQPKLVGPTDTIVTSQVFFMNGDTPPPPPNLIAPAPTVATQQVFLIEGDTPPPSRLNALTDTIVTSQVFAMDGDTPPPSRLNVLTTTIVTLQVFAIIGDTPPPPSS